MEEKMISLLQEMIDIVKSEREEGRGGLFIEENTWKDYLTCKWFCEKVLKCKLSVHEWKVIKSPEEI